MTVTIAALDLRVEFAPREELRTEISAKFTPQRLAGDLAAAGLKLGDRPWICDRRRTAASPCSLSVPGG